MVQKIIRLLGSIRRFFITSVLVVLLPKRVTIQTSVLTKQMYLSRVKTKHALVAFLTILIVIVIAYGTIGLPYFATSVASIVAAGVDKVWLLLFGQAIHSFQYVLFGFIALFFSDSSIFAVPQIPQLGDPGYGNIMGEEVMFRSGSENWNLFQRIRSCIAFGVVHFANLVYPIAVVLALTIVGGIFMSIYLRAFKNSGSSDYAIQESAIVHQTYNIFAYIFFFASLLLYVVFLVF